VFVLLFHKEERLKTMLDLIPPDRISVQYLQLLVNANPEDAPLRLELARQYIKTGNMDEALVVLKPLLAKQGREAIDAKLLSLELGLKLYYGKPATDASKENDLAELKKNIADIANGTVPVDLFPVVIQRCLELGQPELAAKLYQRWTGMDEEHHFDRLKEAGRWYVAAGVPLQAADIYKKAYAETNNTELARQFALLTINALRAADKGSLALAFIKECLQRFPNDTPLLEEAIALALANNDPKQAVEWGNMRLALTPDNPEQINKQVDVALAAGSLDIAWLLSERLLVLTPKDAHVHERTAQIAEWTGKPALALPQWVWLVRQDNKNNIAMDNALRLAKGLNAGETTIELLTLASKKRVLTDAEFNDIVAIFNNANDSKPLVSFLKRYLIQYPLKQSVWETLAKAQENAGLLAEAIISWQYIATHFDKPIQAVIHQAELLRRTDQAEKAYSLLVSNQKRVTVDDTAFWQLSADLSWELKQFDNALLAYKTLWKSETGNAVVAERLIQLFKDKKQPKDAIAIACEAYQRLKEPRWLLLAMDTATQFGLWDKLRQLVQTADADKKQFETLEMYWLILAQLHNYDQQPQQVLADYQQALIINPASVSAKGGILWALMDQQDNQGLASYLDRWQQDAMTAPSLWGVYGLGLSKLGKHEQALPWFERKTEQNHDDYLWLLSYADTLVKANRVDAALMLREYVLLKLRATLQQKHKKANPDELKKLLQPAYLTLFRNMEGVDFEESILQKFSAQGMKDPMVRELVIASYLSQENFAAARFWLLRAHAARLQTPVGQRLTLALADNDQATLADILSKEGDKLTLLDQVEPLKQLGRTDEALAALDKYLQTTEDMGVDQSGLYRYRNELRILQSPQLAVGWDMKKLGFLGITQNQARFTLPLSNKSLAVQFRHNYLNSSSKELQLLANNEIDLAIEGKYPFSSGHQLQLNVGTNLQNQQSVIYGAMSFSYKVSNFLDANVRLGLNELSTETATFRALGAKDKLSIMLAAKLSRQSYFQLDLDGHRYLTRQGSLLGEGYRISSVLGYTLLRASPVWQIRLQGSWESNRLQDNLPDELRSALPSPWFNMQTVIPKSYGTAGIGTTIRYNLSEQEIPRQPYILLDGWVGWAVPANVLAFNGRIALGISLFKADVLSMGAFYGNVQGGQANAAYQGIDVQYTLRF
jgi:predicted Zn-dependent protease